VRLAASRAVIAEARRERQGLVADAPGQAAGRHGHGPEHGEGQQSVGVADRTSAGAAQEQK
jgi:hypothetical protein